MNNMASQFIHSCPFSYYVSPLSSKYSPQPSFLKHTHTHTIYPQTTLSKTDQVSHPYRAVHC